MPDNVLFDDGRGRLLREQMLEGCDLHTILRLPTGIFYAQGVKTNVIFFTKTSAGTEHVWVYDNRTNLPAFGRSNPLSRDRFDDFVKAYGEGADGKSSRKDTGVSGRFRRFSREEIRERGNNLDITWLRDDEQHPDDDLVEPEDLTAAIAGHLRSALG